MRSIVLCATFAAACLWGSTALPCGGGFGQGLSIGPSQKIVVKHKEGVETYVFRPHFCGNAAEFGLILPVPGQLSSSPELADARIFDHLDSYTAPTVVHEQQCRGRKGDADAGAGAMDGGYNGVQVVDKGQVGMFDWVLLKADTQGAFTDWLDANDYPYEPGATSHFDYYVDKGWYFVAFKVTADVQAPAQGVQLCGDLGPLSLSFPATAPVVPARIAAVDLSSPYGFGWQVYAIADSYMSQTSVSQTVKFAGILTADDVTAHPQLSKVAAPGDHVTKLNLEFWGADIHDDIVLTSNPGQTEFRDTEYVYEYVDCEGGVLPDDDSGTNPAANPPSEETDEGCSISPAKSSGATLFASVLGLALAFLRRKR